MSELDQLRQEAESLRTTIRVSTLKKGQSIAERTEYRSVSTKLLLQHF